MLPHLARPASHHQAIPRRRRRPVVLREEPTVTRARVGTAHSRCPRPGGRRRRLQRRLRPLHPCCGQPTWPPSNSTCRCGASGTADVSPRHPITWCSTSIQVRGPPSSSAARSPCWSSEELSTEGLTAWPKTSGSKGLQVYVRAPGSRPSWESIRKLAHDIARRLEAVQPDLVVSNMRRGLRAGKVLIDWSQNHPAKTTVAVYSVRARPHAHGLDPGDLGRSPGLLAVGRAGAAPVHHRPGAGPSGRAR